MSPMASRLARNVVGMIQSFLFYRSRTQTELPTKTDLRSRPAATKPPRPDPTCPLNSHNNSERLIQRPS